MTIDTSKLNELKYRELMFVNASDLDWPIEWPDWVEVDDMVLNVTEVDNHLASVKYQNDVAVLTVFLNA